MFWAAVALCNTNFSIHHRLEDTTRMRLRFVVGQIAKPDSHAVLEEEQRVHQDFHVLTVQETYDNLVLKLCTHQSFKYACMPLAFMSQSCGLPVPLLNNLASLAVSSVARCYISVKHQSSRCLTRRHLQVYTFLQDVQIKANPAYIVKTDDDLYVR